MLVRQALDTAGLKRVATAAVVLALAGLGPARAASYGSAVITSGRLEAQSLAPFVPTPQDVVDRMLSLAQVTSKDVVYDLGCGDGRIVITAAKKYGAHGVGVDIDPQRIADSNANAKKDKVEHLVTFKLEDALRVDVSPATVVTLYLLSSSNLKLRPKLTKELKPGARIVSHAFSMADWEAAKIETFNDASGIPRTLYLWVADGKVRP